MLDDMGTPESPGDFSDDEIDKGWDDIEPTTPPPGPSRAPAPVAGADERAAPGAIASSPAQRPKRLAKSKEERAAKAARKAAKQEARRAERRAASAQNQKRPAPRPAPTSAPLEPSKANGAAKRVGERAAKSKTGDAERTPSVFSHRRSLLIAGVAVCLLLLSGLVWFLGWRNGSTLSLQ